MNIIDLDNQTDLTINLEQLETVALSLTKKEVELIVVNNDAIAELNGTHRAKNIPTDVLSFPMENNFSGISLESMPLGSIVISEDFVKEKALEFKHSNSDEFTLLFIHGLLHLLGFDHETDNGEMRKKEEETIISFGLPLSLIVRTEEF